jgi:DNA-binding NtrC family response regulator
VLPTVVLVVEDDAWVLRAILRAFIDPDRWKVINARSVESALAFLARPELEIEIVVTDLVLGETGGEELARIVRGNYGIPVIIYSGEDPGPGLADAVLLKPAPPSELLPIVARLTRIPENRLQ